MGQRIEKAITESGVDVRRIADECGVSVQAVYAWMRGQVKNLRNENLFSLADVTGYEARWIATGRPPERKSEGDARKDLLTALYDKADRRGKDAILRFAQIESSYAVNCEEGMDRAA